MSDQKKTSKAFVKFEGTPAEIGAQIWEKMCLPAVQVTSNNAPTEVLQQLYVGFLSAALGSMAADFGHENALVGAKMVVDSFAGMDVDETNQRVH
jgi:hypothetical protein